MKNTKRTNDDCITVKIKLSAGWVDYLLITAFEGGINYWCSSAKLSVNTCVFTNYHNVDDNFDFCYELSMTNYRPFSSLIEWTGIKGFGENATKIDCSYRHLTIDTIEEGLQEYIEDNLAVNRIFNLDDLDAEEVDNIIQYAVFGALVFG